MKKILLSFCAIMALSTGLYAQQRTCGTMENMELRKKQDPNLEKRMAEEERKIQDWINQHPSENSFTISLPPLNNFKPTGNIAVDRINYAKAKQEYLNSNSITVKPVVADVAKIAALREQKRKSNSFIRK